LRVDQWWARHKPVDSLLFWPRNDAWEELKNNWKLNTGLTIKIVELLNKATEVINYWRKVDPISEVQAKFPDIAFTGSA